ncbi:unnamed protein product, partial [Urochloa humidicola]
GGRRREGEGAGSPPPTADLAAAAEQGRGGGRRAGLHLFPDAILHLVFSGDGRKARAWPRQRRGGPARVPDSTALHLLFLRGDPELLSPALCCFPLRRRGRNRAWWRRWPDSVTRWRRRGQARHPVRERLPAMGGRGGELLLELRRSSTTPAALLGQVVGMPRARADVDRSVPLLQPLGLPSPERNGEVPAVL